MENLMHSNSELPFVSVIVPVRNEGTKINQCLDSIITQDYPSEKIEVLIVDGMSTDKTRYIVNKYINCYSNFKLINNKKIIAPSALNIGLKNAKGDIIIRVDGHCYIKEDFISKSIYYSMNIKTECVGGRIISINKNFVGNAIALAMSSAFGVGNATFRYSTKECFTDTVAFGAYKKEVFDNIGYFDEELVRCQDDEFNYRLRKYGGKIFFTPKIISFYYPRADLIKLWKQYNGYGFWKIRVMQKHPKMMQIRQFVPFLFVCSILFSLTASFIFQPFIYLTAIIGGSYFILGLLFSFKISIKKGIKYVCLLPVIFAILHLSYGLGFLCGLLKFWNRWRN